MTGNRRYQMVAVLMMMLHAVGVQAQVTTGGDVSGGYLWVHSDQPDENLTHLEGSGNLWLGYKAKDYDWRLSLTGKYKDVEGETEVFDTDVERDILTSTSTHTDTEPFNLTARYDFNWRRPDKSTYSLWLLYDYERMDFENTFSGTESSLGEVYQFFGRLQQKRDVSHKMTAGYRGATRLSTSWTLKSSADVSLLNRKVTDEWQSYNQYVGYHDDMPPDTLGWVMLPHFKDYTVNAGLELTDTVFSREASRLVLGGGLRFKGEGERFRHDVEMDAGMGDAASVEQNSTGFRFFVEPFLSTAWQRGKWSANAEYGLRLYRMTTTDNTTHSIQLYNFLDMGGESVSDHRFTHFTPLMNGRAKLTYAFSKHHSLSLTNSITNRLPTHQQAVICFFQTNEFNKVSLGNPDLKPEVKILFSLDHKLTCGPFSATTSVSAERTRHMMEYFYFGCKVGSRHVIAQTMINDADASVYKLSETLAWNNKWLKASATVWHQWAHYHGIESIRGGREEVNDKNWGWNLDAKASLGCGWQLATNFRFMGAFETLTTSVDRMWQSSTVSVEKRFGPVTLYLNANRLIDPTFWVTKYNPNGDEIYHNISRSNNRIVMLGCRWSL